MQAILNDLYMHRNYTFFMNAKKCTFGGEWNIRIYIIMTDFNDVQQKPTKHYKGHPPIKKF